MSRFRQSTIDSIAEDCIKYFNSLPKTGKPLETEWTVFTCIIQYDTLSDKYEIVSLGTGSKCIGASRMSPLGNVLNDSHAEVMARRGFLLYLYKNIEQCLDQKSSIFNIENSICNLKENIEFVIYSSQLPCGDASIICKDDIDDQTGDIISSMKRSAVEDVSDSEKKRPRLDIHRTGAKCLENSDQDPKLPGVNYHLFGQVRTKPGRGYRTLSVSCSDKMARWIKLGIQGSLIALLVDKPIYIKHFIFGAGVPYSEKSLERALLIRDFKNSKSTKLNVIPHFYQCSITFPNIKTHHHIKPAPGSIVWINVDKGVTEVAVQGKKLGVTKKKENCPSNYLCICKYKLYKKFQEILYKNNELYKKNCGENNLVDIPYNEMKKTSKIYLREWEEIKKSFFGRWTTKPDIFSFKCSKC